jgi:pimeloyl-ACP methyl ester carboxylesterase
MFRSLTLILFFVLFLTPTLAQTNAVETQANDGLTLKGDFYMVDANHPTIILLHQLYTTRASWQNAVGVLTGAGYNVLAVDVRGSGETKGKLNWPKAVEDVGSWMAWLRNTAGVRGDAISTMGSSIGSSLAVLGCANDGACRTAVALSPGWSYYGLSLETALTTQLTDRPILAVYATRDRWPALGIPRMLKAAPNVVVTSEFAGRRHGMELFIDYNDQVWASVLEWLGGHGGW